MTTTLSRDEAVELIRERVLATLDEAALELFGDTDKGRELLGAGKKVLGATDGDLSHLFPVLDRQVDLLAERFGVTLLDEDGNPPASTLDIQKAAVILPHDYFNATDDLAAYEADRIKRQAVTVAYAVLKMDGAQSMWMYVGGSEEPWIEIDAIDYLTAQNRFAIEYGKAGEKIVEGDFRIFVSRKDFPEGTEFPVGPRKQSLLNLTKRH
jgi:hypothetical protein